MHTYTFKIEHSSGYEAVIAISGSINLYGLAEHIIDTVGFDFDHAFGFYDNLRDPFKSSEFYTLFADMDDVEDDGEPGVSKTFIEDVFKKGKRMLFLFDYGDDWMFQLICTEALPTHSKRKIRTVLSEASEAPVQYPIDEEDHDDE